MPSFISKDPSIEAIGDGRLVCHECSAKSDWCDHIQLAVTQGRDAAYIWFNFSGHGDPRQNRVSVPLLPTEGIWPTVRLDPSDHGARVMLHTPPIGRRILLSGQTDFLGFLSPSEGRMVIRQMMIDWFYPESMLCTFECTSMRHSAGREIAMQKAIQYSSKDRIAHAWCITFFRWCLWCTRQGGSRGSFDSDLVPGG